MKIKVKDFCVGHNEKIKLDDWPTIVKPFYKSDKDSKELLENNVQTLNEMQQCLFASDRYALLLIFQGMDASGKDGAIRHVLTGINPAGVEVSNFRKPSQEELKHDFLWRTTCRLPERGRIGVFNRSYYEDVLVVRVHPELLHGEGLMGGADKAIWKERYRSIRDLEDHLYCSNTRIIKFFLHLSKEEQRQRFLARLDTPAKNWKFSLADLHERNYWKHYKKAYEDCLSATSSHDAPWYIIPADDKENARLIISKIVIDRFRELKLEYPKADAKRKRELQLIRKELIK